MGETMRGGSSVGELLDRAQRARDEAERWFRFVRRFEESRRAASPFGGDRALAPPTAKGGEVGRRS